MHKLSIDYRREGQVLQAHLTGSLVSIAALNLKSELSDRLDPWDRLILDLSKVTDVDTTGVNALFQTQLSCSYSNTKMTLKCPQDHPVKKLLKLTHSEREFDIEQS